MRRSRSNSAPNRPPVGIRDAATPGLREQRSFIPDIVEETVSPTTGTVHESVDGALNSPVNSNASRVSPPRAGRRLRRVRTNVPTHEDDNDYEDGLVDMLDVVGMGKINIVAERILANSS